MFDEMDDQAVVDACLREDTAMAAATRVRDTAYLIGSDDNISAVVVLLREGGLVKERKRVRRQKSKIKSGTAAGVGKATTLR